MAKAAFDAAHAALEAAQTAEREAWEALEALAGRTPIAAEIVEPAPAPPQPPVWRSVPRPVGIG